MRLITIKYFNRLTALINMSSTVLTEDQDEEGVQGHHPEHVLLQDPTMNNTHTHTHTVCQVL